MRTVSLVAVVDWIGLKALDWIDSSGGLKALDWIGNSGDVKKHWLGLKALD